MKNKPISRSILCILLSLFLTTTAFTQVRGDGSVVKQDRNVESFNGVEVRSGIDLTVSQGSLSGLVIEADENLQEYIVSEVSNGTLEIYVRKNTNIQKSTRMAAHLTVSDLKTLSISGGGDVKSLNQIVSGDFSASISGGGDLSFDLRADRMACSMSGGGDASLDGEIGQLSLTLSGGGDLKLKGELGMVDLSMSGGGDALIEGQNIASGVMIAMSGGGDLHLNQPCEKLKTTVSGGGDVYIHAGDKVTKAGIEISGGGDLDMEMKASDCMISVSGGGDAHLKGAAEEFYGEMKSGGDLDASGFRIQAAKINLTGGSDASISVENELTLNATGGSQIYLNGDPRVEANLTGGSKIHRK